ncbi:AAA family ATPase [Mycolicibacterium tusciae]|uniref:AAA family ATPase n=1 Tax=Mycolicibacterium tusciae TaxID=75922 RepID=UPI00024A3262|nr:AAA family ATPase [Mycolicibacterium tusciae]
MPNQDDTVKELRRYLNARIPLIVLRSTESRRALELVRQVAGGMKGMSFYGFTRTGGLTDLLTQKQIVDDRSLGGALDYAASTFRSRDYANFVLVDVEDIGDHSGTTRYVAEVVDLAEGRSGSIVLVTSESVASELMRLGMSVELDLPDLDELFYVVTDLVDNYRAAMQIEWTHDEVRRASEVLVGLSESQALNAVSTLLAKGSLHTSDIAELSKYKDRMFGAISGIERVDIKPADRQVGGLNSLRKWLRQRGQLIRMDLSHSDLRPPRGVLLVGVPGCGKSLSAKAIASEWELPLYRLDMAGVLGMYVGQSEGRLREALEMASRVAPCVLWIDEIEKALAGGGSGGDATGITRRMIGQFLYWLQESRAKVFIVATANDVTSLPPELLRKGRFDELFFVDLPDTEDRAEIVRMYFDTYLKTDISPYLLEELVALSDGFAGADIASVIHEVASYGLLEGIEASAISDDVIKDQFRNLVPFSQTNPEEVASIRAWGMERAVPAGRARQDLTGAMDRPTRRIVTPT